MKNKEQRPRCTVCGTYLFNYISLALNLCAEHRPKLSPEKEAEFREFVRNYPKEVQEQVKQIKKQESCDCGHSH